MTKVDFLASQVQYVDHLAPVWAALNPRFRGTFLTSTSEAHQRAESYGIDSQRAVTGAQTTVVASHTDYRKTTGDVILMEHGVGHQYGNDHPSYAGSTGKHRTRIFLCPNEITAAKNRQTYPNAQIYVIGVPKLDKVAVRPPTGRTAAISFHWDARHSPESQTALPHYRRILPQLVSDNRFDIIGHCHPRPGWPEKMKKVYANADIPFISAFDDILAKADVYIVDVSSTAYEFAAAGRPVIHLNSPRYRRHVNHGIRFWDYLPGPTVDHPDQLPDMIAHTLDHPEQYEELRLNAVRHITPYIGEASERAAAAIERHMA